MRGLAALPLLLAATGVQAQELAFDAAQTEACLNGKVEFAELRACIGASATACMDGDELGYTTYGQRVCVGHELAWWDARLNAEYARARAGAKSFDAETMQGTSAVSRAGSLRDMQRAWIAFRDAKCAFERSQWGGGTGGGPAEDWCRLYETAEQAMYLQSQAEVQ